MRLMMWDSIMPTTKFYATGQLHYDIDNKKFIDYSQIGIKSIPSKFDLSQMIDPDCRVIRQSLNEFTTDYRKALTFLNEADRVFLIKKFNEVVAEYTKRFQVSPRHGNIFISPPGTIMPSFANLQFIHELSNEANNIQDLYYISHNVNPKDNKKHPNAVYIYHVFKSAV